MDDGLWAVVVSVVVAVIVILCPGNANAVEVNMDIIRQIESSGNPMAYNRVSGARGLYQITPVVVEEFNQFNKTNYKPNDMFIPVVCEKVAVWYMNKRIPQMMKHFRIKDTVENRLIAYNAGIVHARNGHAPKETKNYINKYRRMANEQN